MWEHCPQCLPLQTETQDNWKTVKAQHTTWKRATLLGDTPPTSPRDVKRGGLLGGWPPRDVRGRSRGTNSPSLWTTGGTGRINNCIRQTLSPPAPSLLYEARGKASSHCQLKLKKVDWLKKYLIFSSRVKHNLWIKNYEFKDNKTILYCIYHLHLK